MSWESADRLRLTELWEEGLSCEQISQAFERRFSRSAISAAARRLLLPERRPGMNCHLRHNNTVQAKIKKSLEPVKLEDEPMSIGVPGEFPHEKGCLWPTNKDGEPLQFCGHPRHERRPWCKHHASRATQPATGRSSSKSTAA